MEHWTPAGTYEGYEIKVHEINDVVFSHEAVCTKDGKEPLKARGTTFDGAVEHAKICVNREITKLGS